jgi:hypothetical protein
VTFDNNRQRKFDVTQLFQYKISSLCGFRKDHNRGRAMDNMEISTTLLDNDEINYDEIPKITNFSKGRKNPFAGKFRNGYTVIVEHKDYDEIIEVKKTKRMKTAV